MKLREASLLMGAMVTDLGAELFDKEIRDYVIDSRSVEIGDLFFALSQQEIGRAHV